MIPFSLVKGKRNKLKNHLSCLITNLEDEFGVILLPKGNESMFNMLSMLSVMDEVSRSIICVKEI